MSFSPDKKQNRLLNALPTEEYKQIKPHLEFVVLDFKQILYEVNQPIEFVYFVLDGVASLLTVMDDGAIAEVGTIGNEGLVGLPVFLGAKQIPGRAIVQVSGKAMRMNAEDFKHQVSSGTVLFSLLQRYTQALFNQIAQSAACNRLHTIEERFCRWILMTQDRVNAEEFFLTQEFLGYMLGVGRPSVSLVAATLQKAGLIHYRRGKMKIVDREGLEATSCECYRIIKEEFERLIGGNSY